MRYSISSLRGFEVHWLFLLSFGDVYVDDELKSSIRQSYVHILFGIGYAAVIKLLLLVAFAILFLGLNSEMTSCVVFSVVSVDYEALTYFFSLNGSRSTFYLRSFCDICYICG